jgi:TRAP-type mannitol/chloroaromatic compound transport system permease small subunit
MSKTIGKLLILVGFLDYALGVFEQPLIHKYSPLLLWTLGIIFIVPMRTFIKFADTLSTSMGKAFSWCIVILMGGTVYEVVMAYVFNKPTLWNFDFSMQMYGAILMMSGAYCLATEAHVRGDVIYRLFSEKKQAWIDLILYFIFFFPGVIALAFYGYEYAALAWKIKETSWSSPAQIQIYMVKSMIPAAGILLIIQGISEVFRSIICIQEGKWPARMVVAEETEKILMRKAESGDQRDVI